MPAPRRLMLAGLLGAPMLARAQPGWAPQRPMRIVVPFPAGGGTDVVARVLAERLSETLGQPVAVENRTGAGGNIGTEAVVRSPPDGHTLLMGTMGALTINQHLYANMGYDPLRDLVPVGLAFETDHVLIVHPAVPAATAQEFLALAKAQPGRLAYGSAGTGSSTHMMTELFRMVAGIEVQHVPYRGSAPALNDTVAGNVQFMMDQVASALPMIQARQVRALAVSGQRRQRLLPDVPTVAELGLAGATSTSWGAIMAPAGTPEAAILRLTAAMRAELARPPVQERLAAAGAEARYDTPEATATLLRTEAARWGRVVRDARITMQ